MDYRFWIRVIVPMSVIVLLVISILAESQETIPECHSYKVDQIRSDHLDQLFVVGGVTFSPEPPGNPSILGDMLPPWHFNILMNKGV